MQEARRLFSRRRKRPSTREESKTQPQTPVSSSKKSSNETKPVTSSKSHATKKHHQKEQSTLKNFPSGEQEDGVSDQDMLLALARVGIANAPRSSDMRMTDEFVPKLLPSPTEPRHVLSGPHNGRGFAITKTRSPQSHRAATESKFESEDESYRRSTSQPQSWHQQQQHSRDTSSFRAQYENVMKQDTETQSQQLFRETSDGGMSPPPPPMWQTPVRNITSSQSRFKSADDAVTLGYSSSSSSKGNNRSLSEKRRNMFGQNTPMLNLGIDIEEEEEDGDNNEGQDDENWNGRLSQTSAFYTPPPRWPQTVYQDNCNLEASSSSTAKMPQLSPTSLRRSRFCEELRLDEDFTNADNDEVDSKEKENDKIFVDEDVNQELPGLFTANSPHGARSYASSPGGGFEQQRVLFSPKNTGFERSRRGSSSRCSSSSRGGRSTSRSDSIYYELSSSGTLHVPGFLVRASGVSPTPDVDSFHESGLDSNATHSLSSPLYKTPRFESPTSQSSLASVESKTQSDEKKSPLSPGEHVSRPRPSHASSLRVLAASNTANKHGLDAVEGDPIQGDALVLLNRVGKGASGVVYKALHRYTLRLVAVKVVPVFDDNKRAQTVSEIKALYRNHLVPLASSDATFPRTCPYILGMHNAFVDRDESTINLVLEWMGGGSVEDRLSAHGPLEEREIACMLHCVLRGLRHLHGLRQLHRDIKPANMLISHRSGMVKLSDFGIAHSFGSLSAANTFVGSLSYMAPERITGDDEGYSYPADLWSVGLSALVCAVGSYPFQTEYDEQGYWGLVQAISEQDPPCLSKGKFSEGLCDLVSKCLQKDPQHRITASEALLHPFLTECYPFDKVVGTSFTEENKSGGREGQWAELKKIVRKAVAAGVNIKSVEALGSLAEQLGLRMSSESARKRLSKLWEQMFNTFDVEV